MVVGSDFFVRILDGHEKEPVLLTLIVPVLNSSSPQAVAADLPEFGLAN